MWAPHALTHGFSCQAARAAGRNPYPHKFHTTMLLPAYVAAYGALQAGEQRADETVAIAGERMPPATPSGEAVCTDNVSNHVCSCRRRQAHRKVRHTA